MGGRAFGFDSKRMDKDEYEDVLALTLARIDSSQHITGIGKGVCPYMIRRLLVTSIF